MFGYVNINKNELKIKDFNKYRAYYCGVCYSLRKRLGTMGRLSLSFDMTFLALLLDGLYDLDSVTEMKRCAPHMIKAHESMAGDACTYSADMNILLAYDNLEDKWYDSKNVGAKTSALYLKRKRDRIAMLYPRQAKAVKDYIDKLHEVEKNREKGIETAAGLTGEMLGEIYAFKDDEWADTLRKLGFFIGKFIYFADAYEDFEKDKKSGQYNPFVLNNTDLRNTGMDILTMMAAEAARMFEMLPVDKNIDILRNIIYSGIWGRINTINEGEDKDDRSV
ncbi:MAG: hypothetical protein IJS80_03045 [Lachnospiraceae bacterium]|nr:hypothetical protein [Lachnospiraceae bacterium]